jgi:hypothetical protein
MKKLLARMILRWYLPRFLSDAHAFNRLLGRAIQMQLGRLSDEVFRHDLAEFYQELDPDSIKRDLHFDDKVQRLNHPGGYKVPISTWNDLPASVGRPGRFNLWQRRFGLLARMGIRADVLILRAGEQVPPHGHYRVVSGFYVLDGQVAIRHYDRVREQGDKLLVRKVLDTELGPGGFTTNSEMYHNIHWLQGLADHSYLFRVTATGTPAAAFGSVARTDSRVYVDPSDEPDEAGLIKAAYVNEEAARRLFIRPPVACEGT